MTHRIFRKTAMRVLFASIALPLALTATAAMSGELYRWTDAKGVTNYSTQPPTDVNNNGKVSVVPNTISVYTPDKDLLDRVEATRQRAIEEEKNPPPVAQRAPTRDHAAAGQTPPAPDCRDPMVNCGATPGSYATPAPIIVAGTRRPTRPLQQAQMPRGATAGNIVGQDGYIPGLSSTVVAPTRSLATQTAAPLRR